MRVSLVNIRCFLLFLLLFCLCAICLTSLYLNSNHVFLLGRRFSSASRAFKPYFIYFFFFLSCQRTYEEGVAALTSTDLLVF